MIKSIKVTGDETEINKVVRENKRRCNIGKLQIEEIKDDYIFKVDEKPLKDDTVQYRRRNNQKIEDAD